MKTPFFRHLSAIALCLCTTTAFAAQAPSRTECIAPAKPGGGFDLTCKLIQVSLMETGAIEKPMRVTYMPGGVGAVAYNAIVAQRPAEAGTVVAFSGGSLLNLSQGKFGRYGVDDVRWLASVGTDYGMIAVRADSPWKDLKSFMTAMEKNPATIVIGAGASIGSQDWMKAALLAQKANVDPHKMRYVAFEGGGAIRQYEGGYTDYQAACGERIAAEMEASGTASGQERGRGQKTGGAFGAGTSDAAETAKDKNRGRQREKKLKFSYMEQKEWETIEDDIAALEEAIADLEQQMQDSARDYTALNGIIKEKEEKEALLEEKMDRWMYLNDLAEKIEAQAAAHK